MDTEPLDIEKLLFDAPTAGGEITTHGGGKVPYRIRLLPPGRLHAIKMARSEYLRSQGIEECTPATAEIFDEELRLRVLAEAVRKPDADEPLTSLDGWRRTIGAAVEHCMRHYTQLEALEAPTDMELAAVLPELEDYVKKNGGAGFARYWKTIDYETLLACFTSLVLRRAD